MNYGFTYKKNCFYFEDENSVLNDPFTNILILKGNSFSGTKKFEQAIALDHEVNHYVQELSINSCITEGFFKDYMAAYSCILSKCDGIHFPLSETGNRIHNLNCIKEDKKEILIAFYELFDVYDFIFNQNHKKPDGNEYYYGETVEPIFNRYSLRFNDLLESYAYHKSYWDFYIRNESGEGAKMLHEIVEKNGVNPVRWRTDGYEVQNMKRQIEWNKPYQLINLLTIIGLPYGYSPKEYLEYCEKDIPLNYRYSPSLFFNSAQRIIFETALNIPSLGYIMSSINKGEYEIEAFSPVHRFYKIIKNIRDNKGYPNAVEGEDFYITFYNWTARINNWPTYQESYNSMTSMLCDRINDNEEVITNYQLLAVYNKNLYYGRFAQDIPINILSKFNLPLIVRTKEKMCVFLLLNNLVQDMSGKLDFYDYMFGTEKVTKYKHINQEMSEKEAFETIISNSNAAVREVLNRLFSEAAFNAYVYQGKFSCPLYKVGCPRAIEGCKEFRIFDTICTKCEKKILRFGGCKSYLNNGGGNIDDCMFLNYLIDYKFNIH